MSPERKGRYSMGYKVEKFPMPSMCGASSGNRFLAKVTNEETGRHCKFAVTVSGTLGCELRSPTPGFPARDEMTEEEIHKEFEDMVAAISEAQ